MTLNAFEQVRKLKAVKDLPKCLANIIAINEEVDSII